MITLHWTTLALLALLILATGYTAGDRRAFDDEPAWAVILQVVFVFLAGVFVAHLGWLS